MRMTVRRGTDQIGGNCIEVEAAGSRIVLDLGLPLMDPKVGAVDPRSLRGKGVPELLDSGVLPPVRGLYGQPDEPPPDALVISHPHLDHFGLASYASPDVPVITGRFSRRLMELTALVTGQSLALAAGPELRHRAPLRIGAFTLTPCLNDHSAFDAYSMLVEAEGKRLFYSGDLRAHGRKARLFEELLRDGPKGVDVLLLEGTTLSRDAEEVSGTEEDVEREAAATFRETEGLALLWTSGQNIDRLVTFFRAARRTGRTLLIDPYTALVLDRLKDAGALPRMEWNGVRVLFPRRISNHLKRLGFGSFLEAARLRGVRWSTVAARPDRFAAVFRPNMLEDFRRHDTLRGASLVYSLWPGYLHDPSYAPTMEFLRDKGITLAHHHVSGHAYPRDLERLVRAMEPKALAPIHTMNREQFMSFGITPTTVVEGDVLVSGYFSRARKRQAASRKLFTAFSAGTDDTRVIHSNQMRDTV